MVELRMVKRQSRLLNHKKDLDDRYCVMMLDETCFIDTEWAAMKKAVRHLKKTGKSIAAMTKTSALKAETTTYSKLVNRTRIKAIKE